MAKIVQKKESGTKGREHELNREIRRLRKELARTVHQASFPIFNPMPVCELGLDGRVIYRNQAARRLFPDLNGRSTRHPWINGIIETVLPQFNAREKLVQREILVNSRWYGQSMHFSLASKSIRIYAWDITRQKDAERSLKEMQENIWFVLESTSTGVWDLDLINHTSLRSAGHDRIFGYPEKLPQWTYEMFLEHIVPEDRPAVDAKFRSAVQKQGVWSFECRICRADGHIRWIWAAGRHYQGEDGVMRRMAGIVQDITERKLAEENLRDSEQKYRMLFQKMGEGFALYELLYDEQGRPHDWKVLEVNDAYTRHTGVARDRIQGRRMSELFPGSVAEYLPRFAQVVATHQPVEVDVFSGVAGRYLHVATFSAGGQRFANVIEDVTERKRSEQALAVSEGKYRTLFNHMIDGVAIHRLVHDETGAVVDYVIEAVNEAYEAITGFNAAQAVEKRASELYGTGAPPYLDVYARVAVSGRPERFETEFEPMHKHFSISVFKSSPDHFTTVFEDITGRKRSEQSLQATRSELEQRVVERTAQMKKINLELEDKAAQLNLSMEQVQAERQHFLDVLETLPAYVALLTPDYHVAYANSKFREWFGESGGRRCYEFLFKRSNPCDNCETYKVLSSNAPHSWEWTGPNGRSYEIYDYPFSDTNGARMILEMGIDVTARKEAEAAQNKTQQELEKSRRLSDLGTLAATVAHELRNPLAAIRMAVHNIRSKSQMPSLDSHLKTIDNKVTVSDKIINNLLLHSRIQPPDYQKIGIRNLLDESINQLENRYSWAKRSIIRSYDCLDDHIIEADPLMLRELFDNVLSNAVEAIDSEKGKVKVSCRISEAGELVATITDDGNGMEPETAAKAFEPFFTTKSRGTGLGLSLCRRIAQMHGGNISLTSQPGRGTTVTVVIPLQQARP